MNNDLLDYIRIKQPHLSKNGRKIAEFILNHYEEAAYLTAAKLGKRVEVSESSVVRFAMSIGFEGYPEFQEKLANVISKKFKDRNIVEFDGEDSLAKQIMLSDINRINVTFNNLDKNGLENAVNAIKEADNIYILGVRESKIIAEYFGYNLDKFPLKVKVISDNCIENISKISEKDVLIVISYPGYSYSCLKALEFANMKKVNTISITNDKNSPMAMYSNYVFIAPSKEYGMVCSMTSAISLANLIITKLSMQMKESIELHIEKLRECREYEYNGGDIIEPIKEKIFDGLIDDEI